MKNEIMALSVKQPFASQIAHGEKTIEHRTWQTSHRGKLLIVSTKAPKIEGLPSGQAVCIVNLTECQRARDGTWWWLLSDARPVEPFMVKGQLGLYKVTVSADFLLREYANTICKSSEFDETSL